MTMPVVLIGPGVLRFQPGRFREILLEAGCELIEPPAPDALSLEQVLEHLPRCHAMLVGGERITASVLDAAPHLKILARVGVGFDGVEIPAASARGILVTITPGTNHGSVAEQAFGLLLALTRRIAECDREIRGGGWPRGGIVPLRGRTMGLVGLGRIGQAMAVRAQAFDMRVIAFDPVADEVFSSRIGIERVSLATLLRDSDVVSLHAPLIESTRHLINRETLAQMRDGAILLNTARGGLVNEMDLLDALQSGRLAGAGLDVLDPEPPALDNPLLSLNNVILSAHVAGIDTLAIQDMAALAADCVVRALRGDWPHGCVVNLELADRFN